MRRLFFVILIGVLFFSLTGPESLMFTSGRKAVAILMSSSGNVKILNSNNKYLREGNRLTKVYPDEIVLTGDKASCVVLFRDRSTVKLNSDTKILLSKVNVKSGDRKGLGVLKGGVFISVFRKSGKSNSFHAFSPTAVAGVRGTQFSINVADDGSTRCSVQEGSVAFGNEKKSAVVNQNNYGEVETGKSANTGTINRNAVEEDEVWRKKRNIEISRNPSGSMNKLEREAREVKQQNTRTYQETRRMRGQQIDKNSASKVIRLDYEASKNTARARAIKETADNMARKYGNRPGVRTKAKQIQRHTSAVERQIKVMDRFISQMAAQVDKLIKQQSKAIENLQNNFMKRGFRKK